MKNRYGRLTIFFALLMLSCAQEQPTHVSAPEQEVILTDSFEIEFTIVNSVFNVPEVRHRIKEKEKINPNVSSTTAAITERPNAEGASHYTVVIEDLADDDSTWYTLGVFHVYYPPIEVFYFDTLLQKEFSREEWQREKARSK